MTRKTWPEPEPATKAGQRLWDRLAEPEDYAWSREIRDAILDIEAEAQTLERTPTDDEMGRESDPDSADGRAWRLGVPPYDHQDDWCWCQPEVVDVPPDGEIVIHKRLADHSCHGYPPGECYCTHRFCDASGTA